MYPNTRHSSLHYMLGTVKLGAECITHIVSPWLWPHFAASCMSSCKKEREWGQSHLLIVTVFTPRYMCPYCRGIIFLILFRYFHAMYKYLCSILSNSYKQQNQKGMANAIGNSIHSNYFIKQAFIHVFLVMFISPFIGTWFLHCCQSNLLYTHAVTQSQPFNLNWTARVFFYRKYS
jgi:hypothetical protein